MLWREMKILLYMYRQEDDIFPQGAMILVARYRIFASVMTLPGVISDA